MNMNDMLILNRIKGFGQIPTVCLPGFVPKSREAFYKQIGLFREFGDVWLADYPDQCFDLEATLAHLSETVTGIGQESAPPVIVSVSFGSALVMQLLQRKPRLPLGGCIFVSPMASLKDIYLDESDATFFGKVAGSILSAADSEQCLASRVAKARKVFKRLLLAGHSRRAGDMSPSVVDEILRSLHRVEDGAVLERLKAMADIRELCGKSTLTTAPALILWAEEEQEVIRKDSANFRLLNQHPGKLFPAGRSVILSSGHPDNLLKHGSLLAHSDHYNREIEEFYLSRIIADEQPA